MAYDLDYYKRQLRYKRQEIEKQRRKNGQIKEQISKLEWAYQRLANIKKNDNPNAEWVKSDSKLKYIAPNVQWRGNAKNKFDEKVKGDVKKTAKDFYKSIDQMQDEVGRALAKKRGELDSGSWLVNSLNRSIQWLDSTIRNWTN